VFLATINKHKQLLYLSFIGPVNADELVRGRKDVSAFLGELNPGFRVLADFLRLESMSVDCAPEIGKVMEMCEQKGIGLVVRVIADQSKDIGLEILTHFHYRQRPQIANCTTILEAARLLSL